MKVTEPKYPGHPDDWSDTQWAHYLAWRDQEDEA